MANEIIVLQFNVFLHKLHYNSSEKKCPTINQQDINVKLINGAHLL